MHAPWVKYLLFILAYMAAFNHGVAAINCSAITVPKITKYYLHTDDVKISWPHTVPNAKYSIKACCTIKAHWPQDYRMNCTKCPVYGPVPQCRKDRNQISGTQCHYDLTQWSITLFFNLTVDVPGCASKSELSDFYISPEIMRMTPVSLLVLQVTSAGLFASWRHDEQGFVEMCYSYRFAEISESGERQEIAKGETKSSGVPVPLVRDRLHAYKVFEVCIKIQHCRLKKTPFSEEICNQTRAPPAAPSEPVELLCDTRRGGKEDCNITKNKHERNITLIWQLPEKSTWNGRPTVIKIKIRFKSMDENGTYFIDINATETNYTLTGLKRNGLYLIQLQFFSNGGGGPSTTPLALFEDRYGDEPKKSPPNPVEELDFKVLIVIVTLSIVSIVAVVLLLGYFLFRSKSKRNSASLPYLQPPKQEPAVQSGTDPTLRTDPADYDFLMMNSEEPQIQLNLLSDESSLDDKKSSSDSTHSTNDSVSSPLVPQASDTSLGPANVEAAYNPQTSGDDSESPLPSGDRSSDV